MKQKTIVLLIFIFSIITLNAYEYLRVLDVNSPWNPETGTIEKSTISIKPKGMYTEYGMYLTFNNIWDKLLVLKIV